MEYQTQQHEPLFSKKTIGRILLFSILVFSNGVIQTSFFPAVTLFPASPDLLLSAVLGLALFDGERSGAIAGIGAGMLAISLGGAGTALLPIFYMMTGYLIGIFARINFKKNIISWFLYVMLAAAARGLLSAFYTVAAESGVNILITLSSVLVPEFVMTVLFSVFNYFLSRLCVLPFRKNSELE